ncbi:MAG: hypothetical protein ACKOCQ_04800 [Candidatus Nitrosotenuis sp.]
MKLGIIASILLLSAALVGPVGYSFAQTAGTNSTSTNSTSATVTTTTETKTETKSSSKPLSDEERIQMTIAEEKAKLAKRFDDKSKMIREKGLQKSKAVNDILAERLKKLDEKRAKANEKEQKKDDRLKEKLLKFGNSTDVKSKYEEHGKKQIGNFEERQSDAKKRFDEQMQKRNEKFDKLVNLKAKRPALEKPSTEDASSSSDTDSSSKESSSSGTSTGSSTGTNSTSSSTPKTP